MEKVVHLLPVVHSANLVIIYFFVNCDSLITHHFQILLEGKQLVPTC